MRQLPSFLGLETGPVYWRIKHVCRLGEVADMSGSRNFASRRIIVPLLAACLAAIPAVAAPSCPVEQAHYVSMADQQWTAGFRRIGKRPGWISSVAFFVRSARTKRSYWFMFDQGSARYVNLISTFDVEQPGWHPPGPDGPSSDRPLGEMHYLSADEQLAFSLDIPLQGTPAPIYILLPDLPEVMWYRTLPMEREGAPLAFFKLWSCD